jgi:hypothetical protein
VESDSYPNRDQKLSVTKRNPTSQKSRCGALSYG